MDKAQSTSPKQTYKGAEGTAIVETSVGTDGKPFYEVRFNGRFVTKLISSHEAAFLAKHLSERGDKALQAETASLNPKTPLPPKPGS